MESIDDSKDLDVDYNKRKYKSKTLRNSKQFTVQSQSGFVSPIRAEIIGKSP
jgi:hypothetical protein